MTVTVYGDHEGIEAALDQIAIETAAVAVLAEADSPQATANKRGHLFEVFIANVLATQGYEAPTSANVNVYNDGIELDVEMIHRVTKQRIICECKAYSSPVDVKQLDTFLGKLSMERADFPETNGLFVALPRLTKSGLEHAKKAEKKLGRLHYYGAYELFSLLQDAKLLPAWTEGPALKSDVTVVVTEHGLAMAACELDPVTRGPLRWVVWQHSGQVPTPTVHLVEKHLARGLPVSQIDDGVVPVPVVPSVQRLIQVQGSSSDFEYQPPASPEFFVGRKALTRDLLSVIGTRVSAGSIVINAKSGWGKSSLALRLRAGVEKAGGVGLVVDARTATAPDYVVAALNSVVQMAIDKGLLTLPPDAALSSSQSILRTMQNATWLKRSPILLGFDQFENVFADEALTKEFRDLALMLKELTIPLTVTYSWKTDVVGWTEAYPYRLRDEIRDLSQVVPLQPFGPREIETLLRRLEANLGDKINRELRQRLKEYSQGLPWLFKKLAGHVISETARGVGQEALAREALNVQTLFESDMARLSLPEQSALRAIARSAPVAVADLDEAVVPNSVLASLLHQRLVVQVGDRVDTYWDTFRDFLNTGRVAVEDSYVIRYAPLGAGRLLRAVVGAGGSISVQEAAEAINTTPTVVFNYARELRLFGVLVAESNMVTIEQGLLAADDQEDAIRATVASALRRHKLHKITVQMLSEVDHVTLGDIADVLPEEFPTVSASSDSWFSYARSFCQWMDYAGLVALDRDGVSRTADEAHTRPGPNLLSGSVPTRIRRVFPGEGPGPALRAVLYLADPKTNPRPRDRQFAAAVRDLGLLGIVSIDDLGHLVLATPEIVEDRSVSQLLLRERVEQQPGMSEALQSIQKEPWVSPMRLAEAHRVRLHADWSHETMKSIGKAIRAWARACGVDTTLRQPSVTTRVEDQQDALPGVQ